MEISLDLAGTGGLDINDLLLKSPQEQKQEVSSEEEWENVDTGEPVSETKVVCLYWMALTCSLHSIGFCMGAPLVAPVAFVSRISL